ncbi:MAG: sulfatase-like hydrolase/transferase [Phycisphaerae bacterium]|nr:sulfatase-like hydrolase/transferase [Phycisphaerae bacterium]
MQSRRQFLKQSAATALFGLLSGQNSAWAQSGQGQKRPNILWITCEDTGPELGCYGDAYADTPNLDRFATQAMRYKVAWSTAPVCAPARTTLISGVYPPSSGAEHMRSQVALPSFMRLYPQFLSEAGYYCTNNSKTDYNVPERGKVWDESSNKAHWNKCPVGKPFFSIFNLTVSHESQIRKRPHTLTHDPAEAPIPPYHPDTPEVRHDWAQYYDKVTEMDAQAGKRLKELADAGHMEDTLVFFYGDHGSGMPRHKRWPYNSGLHVGMMVYVPPKYKDLAPREYKVNGVSDRLVGFIDLAPTLLSLAGVKPPEWMQGSAMMGPFETPPPAYQFGFRGRMDERYDLVRSVRNERYIYIRNYMPHLIYGQYLDYMFQTPTTQVWKRLYDEGKLNAAQRCFWQRKPPEELYDLEADPHEINNLAKSPAHQGVREMLSQALREHILRIRDVGFLSEAQQHSRAAGTTQYEMGHDPAKYPLEKILAMADLASLMEPQALPELQAGLKDSDSAVRYWAAMGLLMRGDKAVNSSRRALRDALKDADSTVRIIAARALGEYGNAQDLPGVLEVLGTLVSPDKDGAYVSMLALNAVDALGDKAVPLMDIIRTMPTKDPSAVARANGYVPRLVQDLKNRYAPN